METIGVCVRLKSHFANCMKRSWW